MTKHARFLQIEAASPEGDPGSPDAAPESESADRARIAAVLEAAPVTAKARIDVAADTPAGDGRPLDWAARAPRMLDAPGEDGPAAEIALDVAPPEGQPFVRCARCGADSSIHATACQHCAAPLDTAEQRAWNDRVWATQQRRSAEERAALDEMSAARTETARRTARPLPDPGMKPPPELLEAPDEDGPILFAALRALQEPRWRWTAGALVAGLPLLLVTLGGPILAKLGWVLVLMVVLSFLPRSAARRLFELWTGIRGR